MAIFIMYGKYSREAVELISAERHLEVDKLLERFGGKMKAEYCMLGEKDVLFIIELPGTREAMQLSIALSRMTGITFNTSAAVTVTEFLELAAEL